tara:strand:- start:179 stop:424 length:246 start_codon:yes stop_codon:yes gene_type:complete
MTPNDVCDFKRKWMMGSYYQVITCSDRRRLVKDWLKDNIPQHLHDIKTYTGSYEDCIRFENSKDFDKFSSWYKEKDFIILP